MGEITSWLASIWWKGPLTFLVLKGLPITIILLIAHAYWLIDWRKKMLHTSTCVLGQVNSVELEP